MTFDQPLWFKAMTIKKVKNLNITLLLGNFHTEMSFLSAIGYVMKNSGLKEVFSLVYAEHSIEKMLGGKHYSRCMRANDLVSTVLKKIIIEQVDDEHLKESLIETYKTLTESDLAINFETEFDNISILQGRISDIKKELSVSETNALWFKYLEMIDILNCNLMAERSSDWDLYLSDQFWPVSD